MRTSGRFGTLTKRITVFSNDPETPKLMLTLKGDVIVDIQAIPQSISFGRLGLGEKQTRELTLKIKEPDKVKITSVTLDNEQYFKLTKKQGAANGDLTYEIKFDSRNEISTNMANVKVDYTGGVNPFLEIPIRAMVVGDLNYPQSLYFAKIRGEFRKQEIVLTSRSSKKFKIHNVKDLGAKLKLTVVESSGPRAIIKAEVANLNETLPERSKYDLTISTDDKYQKEITIPYILSDRNSPISEEKNSKNPVEASEVMDLSNKSIKQGQ